MVETEEDIKPCSCGGRTGISYTHTFGGDSTWMVVCDKLHMGPEKKSRAVAVAAWNRGERRKLPK